MWDKFLPYAIFAYQISHKKSSKVSTFELLYWRQPRSMTEESEIVLSEGDKELIIERLVEIRRTLMYEEKRIRKK
jgi:hypothetical protein